MIDDEDDDFSDLDFDDDEPDEGNDLIDLLDEDEPSIPDPTRNDHGPNLPKPAKASKPKKVSEPKPEPARRERKEPRANLMSGHCRFPQTDNPEESHARCKGYNTAVPDKAIAVCPCGCHLVEPDLECGSCSGVLRLSPHLTNRDGEDTYVHYDPVSGNWMGEYCP